MADVKFSKVNSFKVVGTLVSAEAKIGQKKSNGSGYVSVKTTIESVINGKKMSFDVDFLASETTKDGKVSKLYETYIDLPNKKGERVEISGDIRENRFWSQKAGQLMSSQKLNGKWVNNVGPTTVDEASFEISGFIVKELVDKVNKEQEIYRHDLQIGQANYDDTALSIFTLNVDPTMREIVNGIRSAYAVGQTIKLTGSLDFIVKTETVEEASAFGKITKTYTNTLKNFFIEAGTNPLTPEEGAYDNVTIKALIDAYKAKDAQLMEEKKDSNESAAVTTESTVTSRQTSLL